MGGDAAQHLTSDAAVIVEPAIRSSRFPGLITGGADPLLGVVQVALHPRLITHLRDLAAAADDDTLPDALATLIGHLTTTIESYCGLHVTVADHEWPVTITAFTQDAAPPVTSLRLPLRLVSMLRSGGSRIVFYAARPGALVDLAADLSHVLGVPTTTSTRGGGTAALDRDGTAEVRLDGDLPPVSLTSGIAGLEELSTINRAIGVLIGRGHALEGAREILRRGAAASGTDTHQYAGRLLGR